MQDNEIRFMWKTDPSFTGNCPALFKAPGGYYVQHKRVTDPEIRQRLQALGEANDSPLGVDEEYGYLPADVIDRIRDL
jgi:hypothetical protein